MSGATGGTGGTGGGDAGTGGGATGGGATGGGAGEPAVIRLDQFLPHPPAKVWRALTEPDLIARWLMPGDFRLEAGHRYLMEAVPMPATGFSGTIEAEVLGFEAEKTLRVAWRDADPAGAVELTITWTLRPEGRGTRLFLVQEGLDPGDPLQRRARRIMGDGWRSALARSLPNLLGRI